MGITTSVASNLRKPGTFAEFDVVSGARGLVPVPRRLALIGAKLTAATGATLTPTLLTTEKDAEDRWGKGSEIHLMAKAAFKGASAFVAKYGGGQPEIWACAVADAGGATAQTYTLTVTGPATAGGDVELRVAGRTIRVGVTNGDAAAAVATKIVDALKPHYGDLPVTAAVGGLGSEHIVTLTANNAGANGADIRVPKVAKTVAGVTVTPAAGTAGAGAYSLTPAFDVLQSRHYHAVAVANHAAADVTAAKAYADARGSASAKAWPFVHFGEPGTLATATTLGTGANQANIIVHSVEDGPNLPGEIAATAGATQQAEAHPAKSFDGVEIPLYPPPEASVYTDTEIETALAAGVTPYVTSEGGDRLKCIRMVTTKTTEAGAVFENLLDQSNVRAMWYGATQIDIALTQGMQRAQANEASRKRAYSIVLGKMRELEEAGVYQNVEAHKAELQVEKDAVVKTRFNVAVPASVVPNLHQIVHKHTLIVE